MNINWLWVSIRTFTAWRILYWCLNFTRKTRLYDLHGLEHGYCNSILEEPAASIGRASDVGSRVLQYGGSHLQNYMASYPRGWQFLHWFLPLFREGITTLELKIWVFWDVMLSCWVKSFLYFHSNFSFIKPPADHWYLYAQGWRKNYLIILNTSFFQPTVAWS